MIRVGSERIVHEGRVWIDGYVRLTEQPVGVTGLSPVTNNVHLYAKDKSGTSTLVWKDDADVEHDLSVSEAHNLLSTVHGDTLTGTVVRGDIIAGNATPKWARVAKGAAGTILQAGASDVSWVALSTIDHGALGGLTDDDHVGYVRLAGRAGGQVAIGGTGASDNYTFRSTSHATKGDIKLADEGGHVVVGGGAAASEVRFLEPSGGGTSHIALKAPALAASVTLTLPVNDGDANEVLTTDGAGVLSWTAVAGINTLSIDVTIDGGGSTITTGIKGDLYIPFGIEITKVTMLADQSGSIVVDIWKDSYANFPPTDADSITASAPPTITTATKSQDATLTGWTTTITAGDSLRFNVDSVTTIQRLHISIEYTR